MPRRNTNQDLTLIGHLLHASRLIGMLPSKTPVYRVQLFVVANWDLGCPNHQSDFQRTLETGVDEHNFWENFDHRGSGEYCLTSKGFEAARSKWPDLGATYAPTRTSDFGCVLDGRIEGVSVELKMHENKTDVLIDGKKMSGVSACRCLSEEIDLDIETDGDSANRVLYNMAVDNEFKRSWS